MENMKKLAFGAIATLLVLFSGCDNSKENCRQNSKNVASEIIHRKYDHKIHCTSD